MKPFPRRLGTALVFCAVVVVAMLVGPRARFESAWIEPVLGDDVDRYLAERERAVPALRDGDHKGIVWVDPDNRSPTELALVYLHGFSADRHEVEPLVGDLARDVGANAFFTRLKGHGRDGEAMADASVAAWTADAAEALAIGRRIGDRIVLVGTSTGATLALWTAAQETAQRELAALVLISPNLGPREAAAELLLWPWGGVLARLVQGRERCFEPTNAQQERHWTTCYPTRALLPMMALTAHVRTMDLGPVQAPTLLVYSSDDEVVDPSAALRVLAASGSPPTLVEVTDSGDPAHHVLAGDILSPETTDRVRLAILDFLRAAGAS